MIKDKVKTLENNGLNFDDLYNYLLEIYNTGGKYKDINLDYRDINGAKVIYINYGGFIETHALLYKVMNEGTPLEERNCIRFWNDEGDYVDNATLEDVLNLFNKTNKNILDKNHIYGK